MNGSRWDLLSGKGACAVFLQLKPPPLSLWMLSWVFRKQCIIFLLDIPLQNVLAASICLCGFLNDTRLFKLVPSVLHKTAYLRGKHWLTWWLRLRAWGWNALYACVRMISKETTLANSHACWKVFANTFKRSHQNQRPGNFHKVQISSFWNYYLQVELICCPLMYGKDWAKT